jgi:hypothetical protein
MGSHACCDKSRKASPYSRPSLSPAVCLSVCLHAGSLPILLSIWSAIPTSLHPADGGRFPVSADGGHIDLQADAGAVGSAGHARHEALLRGCIRLREALSEAAGRFERLTTRLPPPPLAGRSERSSDAEPGAVPAEASGSGAAAPSSAHGDTRRGGHGGTRSRQALEPSRWDLPFWSESHFKLVKVAFQTGCAPDGSHRGQ